MEKLKVLQCGHDKSGTYLLFKILRQMLRQNNEYHPFNSVSGIGYIIDTLFPQYKRFPEISEIDHLRMEGDVWGLNFPTPDCRHIPVDLRILTKISSFIYTHETPTNIQSTGANFSHPIYIMRDGRDVVNSMIHFLTDEISLKLCPTYRIDSAKALYEDLSYFERLVSRWHEHLASYEKHKGNFFLVKFEDLVSDRTRVIADISQFLDLPVDEEKLAKDTSFGSMRKSAPQHLRKGKVGDWHSHFNNKHREIFKQIAGDTLVRLGYETSNDW